MAYSYLGAYDGRQVYKGLGRLADCPRDDNIYLISSGAGYTMVVNGAVWGHCDSRYCVERFEEPRTNTPTELNFTASSWTSKPNPSPLPKEEEKKPEPAAQEDNSPDFWTRVQDDIAAVLEGAGIWLFIKFMVLYLYKE